MAYSSPNLIPTLFQESIFPPITRPKIAAQFYHTLLIALVFLFPSP
jgi:hypothetical protein